MLGLWARLLGGAGGGGDAVEGRASVFVIPRDTEMKGGAATQATFPPLMWGPVKRKTPLRAHPPM